MNDYFYFKVTKAGVTHGSLQYETDKIYKVARRHIGTVFYAHTPCVVELSPVDAIAAGGAIDVFDAIEALNNPRPRL